jgi:hypothetical protein
MNKEDLTINRTPNPNCPACQKRCFHTDKEFDLFHPYAKHGYNKEQGWSRPDLDPKRRPHDEV